MFLSYACTLLAGFRISIHSENETFYDARWHTYTKHETTYNKNLEPIFHNITIHYFTTTLPKKHPLQYPQYINKVASLPRRDRIAIGKAIVGRLGKDDNWVTNSTAGWTFAAATREMPEGCRWPVSVEKLRQVNTYCTAITVAVRTVR